MAPLLLWVMLMTVADFNELWAAKESNTENLKQAVQEWLKDHQGIGISAFVSLHSTPSLHSRRKLPKGS
jgi:hypothetical protein